jgi:hypothetical protein
LGATTESFGKDLIALENDWRAATFSSSNSFLHQVRSLPWQIIFISAGIALAVGGLMRRASRLR